MKISKRVASAVAVSSLSLSAFAADKVYLNQWGFTPEQSKVAIVKNASSMPFTVTRLNNGAQELSATTRPSGKWEDAGMTVSLADISAITAPGEYRLSVDGADPVIFTVHPNPYGALHDAVIKAYYYNRAGMALDQAFAGKWHRRAGHPDTQTLTLGAPDTDPVDRSKGWYDAGDYNKYIVNSGISTYTLLRAYLDHSDFYDSRHWNIPESMNNRADLLDEILWNLDWMVTMQDSDGGVFHKLTTLSFSGPVMPDAATATRYATAKSTAAALNFAAVMSVAARVFDERRDDYLERANRALQWAQNNPKQYYTNEDNVKTGQYGDTSLSDEHNWAAIEYAISQRNSKMLSELAGKLSAVSAPSWANVTGLSYLSLLRDAKGLLRENEYQSVKSQLGAYADQQVDIMQANAFRIPVVTKDFVWGSNAVMMNKAMLLENAYRLTDKPVYRTAVFALVDYIGGRNPTGYSFVTGFGNKSPRFIHHRPSEADGIADPVPGWLAGGPQNGHQDGCRYPSDLPATSYLDDWCSYSTNEITINWNAPLVYVLASVITGK
ncbi:glycoside hydrolase family 9 protein [Alteromonas sp. H39]|uniref:glycoside hydrolase family 9 protein n=1 Tax=Alteromonas sp. H39 TaxID=3389876 RepID=UPI0039DF5E52